MRALASWLTDVGVFPVLTGTVGAALVLLRPSDRALGIPLLLIVLPDLLVPADRASVLSVDPLAPLRSLSVASFAVLCAVALQTALELLERTRLPFARAVSVLLLAFSAAILAIASEEATLRVDRSAARSVEVFTDEALERLPARAVLLVRSDATAYRLWAARLVRGQRPDVTVIPLPLLTRGRVAQRALTRRTSGQSLARIIEQPNPLLRGWFGYFKHGQARTLATLDAFVRRRLRSILCKREGRSYVYHRSRYNHQRWPNAFFAEQGLFTMYQAWLQASQSR